MACNAVCNFRTFSGGVRLIANLPALVASCAILELRSLPSVGITRLLRYYGPLRHPTRPGLSLAGVPLAPHAPPPLGLPVFRTVSLCTHAVATTPAGLLGCCRSPLPPSSGGLPRIPAGSAPALPFSRPAQRLLALRPAHSPSRPRRPFPPKASAVSLPPPPLRLLPAGTAVAGWDLHPLKTHDFARRTRIRGWNLDPVVLPACVFKAWQGK